MILMTDGEYNSRYANGVFSGPSNYTNYGSDPDTNILAPNNGDVYTQAKSLCTAIKATGIELYVITFQLDKTKPWRVDLTTSCASDAAHLIDADTTSLDSAFSMIASNINALRITN